MRFKLKLSCECNPKYVCFFYLIIQITLMMYENEAIKPLTFTKFIKKL